MDFRVRTVDKVISITVPNGSSARTLYAAVRSKLGSLAFELRHGFPPALLPANEDVPLTLSSNEMLNLRELLPEVDLESLSSSKPNPASSCSSVSKPSRNFIDLTGSDSFPSTNTPPPASSSLSDDVLTRVLHSQLNESAQLADDLAFAKLLQAEANSASAPETQLTVSSSSSLPLHGVPLTNDADQLGEAELRHPTPDLGLYLQYYDSAYFGSKLSLPCVIKWSMRMTLAAGYCTWHGKAGGCEITLSAPLLQYRPRKGKLLLQPVWNAS